MRGEVRLIQCFTDGVQSIRRRACDTKVAGNRLRSQAVHRTEEGFVPSAEPGDDGRADVSVIVEEVGNHSRNGHRLDVLLPECGQLHSDAIQQRGSVAIETIASNQCLPYSIDCTRELPDEQRSAGRRAEA